MKCSLGTCMRTVSLQNLYLLLKYAYNALLSCVDSASPATCTAWRLVPWLTCALELQERAILYAVNKINHSHRQDAIIGFARQGQGLLMRVQRDQAASMPCLALERLSIHYRPALGQHLTRLRSVSLICALA